MKKITRFKILMIIGRTMSTMSDLGFKFIALGLLSSRDILEGVIQVIPTTGYVPMVKDQSFFINLFILLGKFF